MKQLLSLSLFLLPCLAWAQYPSNGNQKITLGEQTSADGLIFRGVANDTNVITPFSDTSAYIILDTVNSKFYHYNITSTYWALAGGGTAVTTFSGGTTGLTPNTATSGAVTLGGTLAVANGGTGADMSSLPNNYLVRKNSSGVFDTAAIYEAGGNVGIGTASPAYKLHVNGIANIDNSIYGFTAGQSAYKTYTKAARFEILSYQSVGGPPYTKTMDIISNADTDVDSEIRFFTAASNSNPSEKIRILGNGNVGIGTTNPAYKLHVNGIANIDNSIYGFTAGQSAYKTYTKAARFEILSYQSVGGPPYTKTMDIISNADTDVDSEIRFFTAASNSNPSEKIRILGNGNVGIGTATPAVQFHTTSNVRFAGLVNYDPVETDADGDIIDGGASDFNLKNSIEPINYGLNSINQLKPVSYLWNDVNRKLDSTIPDIGFIAQDVMDVIPEAVKSNGDGDLQLNYKAITATLVKAIQEQQALIKALEQRIINLENK
jgi:hypothetical protein